MTQNESLAVLRCPDNRSALTPANDAVLRQINAAIRGKRLVNRAGKHVERLIEGGLIRADGEFLYPVIDQIPLLLVGEAIAMDQLSGAADGPETGTSGQKQ